MKSSNDEILYIDVDNRQTRFINANELKKGDVFSQQTKYNYDIISTTYDKNYPLSPFSKDLMNELNIDDIGMYSFADVVKFSKFNIQIKYIYSQLIEYIKIYIKKIRENTIEDINIDDIEIEADDTQNIKIQKLIKELKETIARRYYLDLCCCCLFRIKLTNKTGLLIEKCSQYQDQKEILIPDPTFFIVKNISREKYKVINPFAYYKKMETFSINGVEYNKFHFLPEFDKSDFDTKMLTVYDVEIIDISKYKDEKSWFSIYNVPPNLFEQHSDPILYHRKSLEELFSHMSKIKSSTSRKSQRRKKRRSL